MMHFLSVLEPVCGELLILGKSVIRHTQVRGDPLRVSEHHSSQLSSGLHRHEGGQMLYGLAGDGLVVTRSGGGDADL